MAAETEMKMCPLLGGGMIKCQGERCVCWGSVTKSCALVNAITPMVVWGGAAPNYEPVPLRCDCRSGGVQMSNAPHTISTDLVLAKLDEIGHLLDSFKRMLMS